MSVVHVAAHNEDEGFADELRDVVNDSDSEVAEDREDVTTLFSGFVKMIHYESGQPSRMLFYPSCRSHPDIVDNNRKVVRDLQCKFFHSDASCHLAKSSPIAPFSPGWEKLGQDLGENLVPTLTCTKEVHPYVSKQNNAQFQQDQSENFARFACCKKPYCRVMIIGCNDDQSGSS